MTDLTRDNPADDNLASKFYDNFWRKSGDKLNYAEMFRIHFITKNIKRFAHSQSLKILDYGCGKGWMAPFLAQWGHVTGVDFGPAGIEIAKRNYGHIARFLLLDANGQNKELALLFNDFDVVVCSEVIEHARDQLAFLKNLFGFLKSNGYCILTTPNGLMWPKYKTREAFLRRSLRIESYLQPVENWRTPNELVDLFQKANFTVLNHEGIISHQIGMPPWGNFIKLEWHLYHLLQRFNKHDQYSQALLKSSLYQCIIGQKKVNIVYD